MIHAAVARAWSIVLCLLATSARADAPATDPQVLTAPDVDGPRLGEARAHIARGESLFNGGNYEGALVEFQRAHALLDGHPVRYQTLYNIGLCHERLLQYTAAIASYERYLREGGSAASDAPLDAQVFALVHGAHAALAEQAHDAIALGDDAALVGIGRQLKLLFIHGGP